MLRKFFWCILSFQFAKPQTIWPTKQLTRAISYFMKIFSSQIVSSSTLDWAHPVVREWFLTRLGVPTASQQRGWPQILAGKMTVISAPTGKTLAAFLACIDRLVRKALPANKQSAKANVAIWPLAL